MYKVPPIDRMTDSIGLSLRARKKAARRSEVRLKLKAVLQALIEEGGVPRRLVAIRMGVSTQTVLTYFHEHQDILVSLDLYDLVPRKRK